MRFEKVARELYGRPWCITPQVYGMFHDVFQSHLQDGKLEVMGMEIEYKLPQEYAVVDGVAMIQIDGALGHRLPAMAKACMGMVDYLDIREAIAHANENEAVKSIMLNISSPGGAVTGLKETATEIQNSEKPVVGYSDSLVASAGYYLMAACDEAVATESSEIGCIGTLMTWIDVTGAYEKEGLKREMISSGKYKGMMFPGLELTEEQRSYLQDEVDFLADEFKSFVRENRGDVSDEAMQGQTFVGKLAIAENLIDKIANIETAIQIAKGEIMSKVKTRKEISEELVALQEQVVVDAVTHEETVAAFEAQVSEQSAIVDELEEKSSVLENTVIELTENVEALTKSNEELALVIDAKNEEIEKLKLAISDPAFADASIVPCDIDQAVADAEADLAESEAEAVAEDEELTIVEQYESMEAGPARQAFWNANKREILKELESVEG